MPMISRWWSNSHTSDSAKAAGATATDRKHHVATGARERNMTGYLSYGTAAVSGSVHAGFSLTRPCRNQTRLTATHRGAHGARGWCKPALRVPRWVAFKLNDVGSCATHGARARNRVRASITITSTSRDPPTSTCEFAYETRESAQEKKKSRTRTKRFFQRRAGFHRGLRRAGGGQRRSGGVVQRGSHRESGKPVFSPVPRSSASAAFKLADAGLPRAR